MTVLQKYHIKTLHPQCMKILHVFESKHISNMKNYYFQSIKGESTKVKFVKFELYNLYFEEHDIMLKF